MPGIVGLITKAPREQAEPVLLRMLETLKHEPFYKTGTWIDESLGVYVGWTALDESFAGQMPVRNETGSVTLVFSGEEFPEAGTVIKLKQRGHSLNSDTAEYLVHLYEEDEAFPKCLNGRFHGLLVDRERGEVMLFNDRYGMHRVYYHQSQDTFYFAAEAKAILGVRPELKKFDPRGLGEFISCGCVFQNRTLFDQICTLPPAARWTFRNRELHQKAYHFDPSEWEQQSAVDSETYYRDLRDSFLRVLPRYFKARQPIAMSLTGGLDTRMILACQKPGEGMLPCYTFGGSIHDSQDVLIARKVARLCGQPHTVIRLDDAFLKRFPHYAERAVYLTDGCVDANRAADLYINEAARQIAPIRLTGNYGGEVMRRVRAFKPVEPLTGLYSNELIPYIHQSETTYANLLTNHPVSFAVFQQAPWHHYGLLALEQTQLTLRTPYLDNDLVRTVFRAPESCLGSNLSVRLIKDGDETLSGVPTDRGLGVDAGLQATLSHAFLEFQFKAEYAYDYGMPQWAVPIDRILSGLHLERVFLGRHKFAHFRIWYRDMLSSYVRDMLLDSKALSRSYVEPRKLQLIVNSHLAGTQNHTLAIHKLLTLELIHRLLLENRN